MREAPRFHPFGVVFTQNEHLQGKLFRYKDLIAG